MRNVSKKATVVILVVLSILVLGVGAFIVLQIQGNQAPTDSSASGFGPEATRDLFGKVSTTFMLDQCNEYLTQAEAGAVPETFAGIPFGAYIVPSLNRGDTLSPLLCTYDAGGFKQILVELVAYSTDAVIDASSAALISRINTRELKTVIDQGFAGVNNDMSYYYAEDKDEVTTCTTVAYQRLNDLEYVTIKLVGFGECSTVANVARAKAFTQIITQHISETMLEVYLEYRGALPTSAPGVE